VTNKTWKNGLLMSVLLLGAHYAQAQTMTESAVISSNSSIAAQGAKAPSLPTPNPAKQSSSPHLVARNGPPPQEINRKEFEDNAGEKGGKLLLRSVPSGADIFIDGLIVGRTPLLMIIAPGKYKIDMRGSRDDWGHASVGLMPKETQTVVINLSERYPTGVSIH
jgi:PEGA domain-containing protein